MADDDNLKDLKFVADRHTSQIIQRRLVRYSSPHLARYRTRPPSQRLVTTVYQPADEQIPASQPHQHLEMYPPLTRREPTSLDKVSGRCHLTSFSFIQLCLGSRPPHMLPTQDVETHPLQANSRPTTDPKPTSSCLRPWVHLKPIQPTQPNPTQRPSSHQVALFGLTIYYVIGECQHL